MKTCARMSLVKQRACLFACPISSDAELIRFGWLVDPCWKREGDLVKVVL
jgi:hypothetical protein